MSLSNPEVIGWHQASQHAKDNGRADHLFYLNPLDTTTAIAACGNIYTARSNLVNPVSSDSTPGYRCNTCRYTKLGQQYKKDVKKPVTGLTSTSSFISDTESLVASLDQFHQDLSDEIERLAELRNKIFEVITAIRKLE